MVQWTIWLGVCGDPIEQEGVIKCNLDKLFPKYAEFWGKYVYPNRNQGDSSKLKDGFPPEIEDIFNNHYYIFYQLTIAYRQISAMPDPDRLVDVSTPFYHLGTAIDMVERTFILASKVIRPPAKLNWKKKSQYFTKYVKPVLGKLGEKFLTVSGRIRTYRNVLTHSLAPLKLLNSDSSPQLPKPENLKLYKHGRWSSELKSTDERHYSPAKTILMELWKQLVTSLNELWDTLLAMMEQIRKMPKYKTVIAINSDFKFTSGPESGQSTQDWLRSLANSAGMGQASGVDALNENLVDGSLGTSHFKVNTLITNADDDE